MRESDYLMWLIEAYVFGRRQGGEAIGLFDSDLSKFREFHCNILDNFFKLVEDRFGDNRMVFKEPGLIYSFPEMAELMPNAYFIVMKRDIRDVIASQTSRRQRDGREYTREEAFFEVREHADMYSWIKEHNNQLLSSRLIEVNYEDLTTEPEEELKRITDFLELSTVNYDWWPSKRNEGEDKYTDLHARSVSPNSVGRHHSVLQSDFIKELEKVALDTAEQMGVQNMRSKVNS